MTLNYRPPPSPDSLAFQIPPKKGAPFWGRFELVQASKSGITTTGGAFYRDSEGRLRLDFELRPSGLPAPLTVAVTRILDYEADTQALLNHHSRTAIRSKLEVPPEVQSEPEPTPGPTERREMFGLSCHRSHAGGSAGETEVCWYSPKLGIIVALETEVGGVKHRFRFTELRAGDVDPSFFEIPQGYSVDESP